MKLTAEEREKIDAFIRERGVTVCPPFGLRESVTAASAEEVRLYWMLDGGNVFGVIDAS